MKSKIEIFLCDCEDCQICMEVRRVIAKTKFADTVCVYDISEINNHPEGARINESLKKQQYNHPVLWTLGEAVGGCSVVEIIKIGVDIFEDAESVYREHYGLTGKPEQ